MLPRIRRFVGELRHDKRAGAHLVQLPPEATCCFMGEGGSQILNGLVHGMQRSQTIGKRENEIRKGIQKCPKPAIKH